MSPGRFPQRQGDVVHDVPCTEVRIPLREMEQCFREILVQHEDYRFTDPTTRVLVMTVSQSDDHFFERSNVRISALYAMNAEIRTPIKPNVRNPDVLLF